MIIGRPVRRHWALALDRCNVRVVRWRLGQDPAPEAGMGHLDRAEVLTPILGSSRRGRTETWTAASGDWIATRLLPASPGRASAAVVLLHGWLATPLHLTYLSWRVRPLLRAGIEVWLPRLPAHMERTPAGAVSGVRCLGGSVRSTATAIEAAASETVGLGRWLTSRVKRVGLWGISLGGWIAALAVTRDPLWQSAVLWAPVVDPREALLRSSLAQPLRELRDHNDASSRGAFAIDDHLVPIARTLVVDHDDVLVISGTYDNVATKPTIDSLCERWSVRSLQLDHGHISQMMSRRAWCAAREFVIKRLVERDRTIR